MKKIFLLLSILVLVTLACDLSVTVAPPTVPASLPTNTTVPTVAAPTQLVNPATPTPEIFISLTQAIPATVTPNATVFVPPPPSDSVEVSAGKLSLVLSAKIASGMSGRDFPRAEGQNIAHWDVTPGHSVFELDNYRLQGKSLEPQIYIYPAQEYVELYPPVFESMHRLNNILYDPNNPQLPAVPFFNAQQAFASNVQVMSFQNGKGVRFLTEYAQYPVSANNQDLFYQFQGFTSDGFYYIVAIFPISLPVLAETSDAGAALPVGGVPYPYYADPNADMQAYYNAVTNLLNAASPEAFTPTLSQLDSLVQSMRVAP